MNKQERDRLREELKKRRIREGGNYYEPTMVALLDHIDALERLVEAAFREGYSAGNSAGNIGMIQEGADKTACWNISRAKAALTQAEEKGNAVK